VGFQNKEMINGITKKLVWDLRRINKFNIILNEKHFERVYLSGVSKQRDDQRKSFSYIFFTPMNLHTEAQTNYQTLNQILVTISNSNGCLSYLYKVT
jgi:hypothetical protein